MRIRKARHELKLTLAAVAGTDFTRAFLNQVELGRAQPSTHTLQIIADRLQRPIEYFLQDPELSTPAIELALAEAQTRLMQRDMDRAQALLEQLLARRIPLEARTRAQLHLAEVFLGRGRPQEAIDLLGQAVEACERAGSTAIAVELYDRTGSAHYLARRLHEAALWFDRALSAYEATGLADPTLRARILGHRANIHYVSGQPQDAIAAYESAIEAAEQILDMPGLAGIYEGLALSFQETGQLSRALTYAQRSLRLFETLQDVRMSAQLRNNMADMLLQQGKAQDAERLFEEGAAQLDRIGDQEMLPFLLAGAAEAALALGRTASAAERSARAMKAAGLTHDPLARIAAFRVEGRVADAQGRADDSRRAFEHALAVATEVDQPELRARVTYEYARALEAQGNAAEASALFRAAYEAKTVAAGA
jgi:HTH-type transcriptional regulator, quorum sensing regulator NprR